jgi:hypothetical protein
MLRWGQIMAGQQIDTENTGSPSWQAAADTTLSAAAPSAALSSYESYLRVKNGVSDSVLAIAGLPPAGELSYAAYLAAFGAKTRPSQQAAGTVPEVGVRVAKTLTDALGQARKAMQGKRRVLIMAGTGAALLSAFFIGAAIDTQIFGGDQLGAADAQVMSARMPSGPILLTVTQVDDLLTTPIVNDLEYIEPLPTISGSNFTPLADPSDPGEMSAGSSLPTKVSKKVSQSAEGGTGKKKVAQAKLETAKVTKQSAKPVSASTPKKVSAKGTKVARADTSVPPPLRWLDQVFEDLSDSLGGSETSARKAPGGGDRESKR